MAAAIRKKKSLNNTMADTKRLWLSKAPRSGTREVWSTPGGCNLKKNIHAGKIHRYWKELQVFKMVRLFWCYSQKPMLRDNYSSIPEPMFRVVIALIMINYLYWWDIILAINSINVEDYWSWELCMLILRIMRGNDLKSFPAADLLGRLSMLRII